LGFFCVLSIKICEEWLIMWLRVVRFFQPYFLEILKCVIIN
jgi:hypothetical protein